ncbi:MAG: HutD family protein [Clostridia bacterium]|nr:HutD family protein [Clostridia bacterium]
MKVTHIRKNAYTTSAWSGGTTTQLYIYPADADYASRRFNVRISSAAVDLEESDFTPLPGVDRWITPLMGGFTLTHPGQSPVVMGPMSEPYHFSGGIETHCVGKALDFNLMLKEAEGRMELTSGMAKIEKGLSAFYPIAETNVLVNGESYMMEGGELLVIESEEEDTILLGEGSVLCCYAQVK